VPPRQLSGEGITQPLAASLRAEPEGVTPWALACGIHHTGTELVQLTAYEACKEPLRLGGAVRGVPTVLGCFWAFGHTALEQVVGAGYGKGRRESGTEVKLMVLLSEPRQG